jgi:hypothetical protein
MSIESASGHEPRTEPAAPSWLRALGDQPVPSTLTVAGTCYRLERVFKHDFFAATALYRGEGGKLVLKAGRSASLFGLPLDWIGRWLCAHEMRLYGLVAGIAGVPRLAGRWGRTGLLHEYVEGRPLSRSERVDDRFFHRLATIVSQMHDRGIAYVDLEKPENIILGVDGHPYLIDFQISWHLPANRGGGTWPARWLLQILQAADRYHLAKHWRRLRPDQLASGEAGVSTRPPFWIRWHRAVFRPITLLRRQILVWLGARDSVRMRSPG